MKFLAMTLIPYAPDPVTGIQPSPYSATRSATNWELAPIQIGGPPGCTGLG